MNPENLKVLSKELPFAESILKNKDVECPYCKKQFDLKYDDDFNQEDTKHQIRCPQCEKLFVFETIISFYYDSKPADCLNTDKHNYIINKAHPVEFSQMQCTICGTYRQLTEKERIEFNIDSKQNYFIALKESLEKDEKLFRKTIDNIH